MSSQNNMFDETGKFYANDIRAEKSDVDQQLTAVDLEEAAPSIPDTATDSDSTVAAGDEQQQGNHHAPRRTKPFVYVVAATAALGSLIFGFSLTGAGGTFVMDGFREEFGWDSLSESEISKEESLITSLQSVGSIFGALFNSLLLDRIGRKWTIFVAALVFAVGAVVQCSAPVVAALYVGRVIGGFGVGMLAMSVPVYIGECSPSHRRGQLTTFWQVGVTVGMLIGTAINLAVKDLEYGWRFSYGGPIVFALILALAMATFMPESPRYLASEEDSEEDMDTAEMKRHRAMTRIMKVK